MAWSQVKFSLAINESSHVLSRSHRHALRQIEVCSYGQSRRPAGHCHSRLKCRSIGQNRSAGHDAFGVSPQNSPADTFRHSKSSALTMSCFKAAQDRKSALLAGPAIVYIGHSRARWILSEADVIV
jgi:hypothetical protein